MALAGLARAADVRAATIQAPRSRAMRRHAPKPLPSGPDGPGQHPFRDWVISKPTRSIRIRRVLSYGAVFLDAEQSVSVQAAGEFRGIDMSDRYRYWLSK